MRQAPRRSTVHSRAIVAAVLALGFVLAIAALAWAAPAVSIDSGPSGPTNDTTPSFGFTVDASATTVECSIDQGTAAYGPCTSGSTDVVTTPLADGSYTFRVRATDAQSEQTEVTQSFTVDTTPPSLSIDSGPSGPTNDTTPSFGFTAEAGATVQCSIDQGTAAYGPCTSGSTDVVTTPLSDGDYTFRVQATDAAGNQTVQTQSFTVDTVPPTVGVDSGPSGPTNDTTPSFDFTAEAGASVECSVDQGTPVYGPCTSQTSDTVTSPLADGSYTFRVRATDAAGNQAVATQAFTVDTTPPSLSIDSGPSDPTNDSTPLFGFTAEAGATVQCSIDQGIAAYGPCTSGSTDDVTTPLADGAYTFRVQATDAAGNQTVETWSFTVDTTPPSLSIDSGPSGPTSTTMPVFTFTVDASATRVECSIDQGTPVYGPCSGLASDQPAVPLSDGAYVFRVRATDALGNQRVVRQPFTVDTTPPSLSIDFGPSGTTGDSTPVFGFTAEAGATVACSIDQGTPSYRPCASAAGDAAFSPLADGAYVFRVRATDAAGNQTVKTRSFTVDTAPQTPTPASPTPDPTVPVTPPATTPATPPPLAPQLLSPFPLVRISGTLTATGARIRLLSVRAPRGALVRVAVTPACSRKQRSSRRCRVLRAAATVGRSDSVDFRGLARAYRSGTVIVVRVWRADRIGKYTRFTIVRGKAPARVDQCLLPAATHGSRCPSD